MKRHQSKTIKANPDDKETIVSQKSSTKKSWFPQFIALLALFLAVAGIAVGYKTWNDVNSKTNHLKDKLQEVELSLDNKAKQQSLNALQQNMQKRLIIKEEELQSILKEMRLLATSTQHYSESVGAQISDITYLQAQVQQTAAQQFPVKATWLLSEIEYLLRLANHQLQLSGNASAALSALKTADRYLVRLAMPHYLSVRQQLSQDIARLEQYQTPDITGLSLQIVQLIEALSPIVQTNNALNKMHSSFLLENNNKEEKAFLNSESQTKRNEEADHSVDKTNSSWQQLWDEMQTTLTKAVSIRKHSEPLRVLLDSESQQLLYELLRMRLETLRLLALKQQDAAYHQQISWILTLSEQYYPQEKHQSLQIILKELDKIQLEPERPDISGGLKRFLIAQRTQPRLPETSDNALKAVQNTQSKNTTIEVGDSE